MKTKISSFRTFLIIIGFIAAIALVNFLISPKEAPADSEAAPTGLGDSSGDSGNGSGAELTSVLQKISVTAPGGTVQAELADSDASQELGLGGRTSMAADAGMLFAFSEPGIYSFWMKDMNFPLDMVWMDEDKTVVGVTADIPADSYPETYSPDAPVSYVLELNSGAAKRLGIVTGTQLSF